MSQKLVYNGVKRGDRKPTKNPGNMPVGATSVLHNDEQNETNRINNEDSEMQSLRVIVKHVRIRDDTILMQINYFFCFKVSDCF